MKRGGEGERGRGREAKTDIYNRREKVNETMIKALSLIRKKGEKSKLDKNVEKLTKIELDEVNWDHN